jgi:hypothetical protein
MLYMILETFLVMKKPNLNKTDMVEGVPLNHPRMGNTHSLRFLLLLECTRKRRQLGE